MTPKQISSLLALAFFTSAIILIGVTQGMVTTSLAVCLSFVAGYFYCLAHEMKVK